MSDSSFYLSCLATSNAASHGSFAFKLGHCIKYLLWLIVVALQLQFFHLFNLKPPTSVCLVCVFDLVCVCVSKVDHYIILNYLRNITKTPAVLHNTYIYRHYDTLVYVYSTLLHALYYVAMWPFFYKRACSNAACRFVVPRPGLSASRFAACAQDKQNQTGRTRLHELCENSSRPQQYMGSRCTWTGAICGHPAPYASLSSSSSSSSPGLLPALSPAPAPPPRTTPLFCWV